MFNKMLCFKIGSKTKLYRVVIDDSNGITVSLSTEFTNLKNCKRKLKEVASEIKLLHIYDDRTPYIMVQTNTYEKLKENK